MGLLGEGLLVLLLAWVFLTSNEPQSTVAVFGLAACFIPYTVVLIVAGRFPSSRTGLRISLMWLAFFGSAFVLMPPVLSDDVFRFVWEGRAWLEGFNPYRLAPSDAALEHLRDDVWSGINNKHLASIYPPLSQGLFVLVALLGGGVWTVKLIALGAHAVTTVVVSRISSDPRAPFAIALNPLLLSAGALDGHLDVLTGLALLVAAWALWRERIVPGVVAVSAAVGLKVVGLVMAPLFLRRPVAFTAIALVSAALLLPMAIFRPTLDAVSGPVQFATTWEGNQSAYAIVEWVCVRVFEGPSATWIARVTVVGVVFAVGVLLAVHRAPPLRATRIIVWTTLLLSPQVHPWYLAWLLPVEVVCGGLAGLVWSAIVLCAYVPIDRWLTEGVWEMPTWLLAVEYAAVALGFAVEGWLRNVRRAPSERHIS